MSGIENLSEEALIGAYREVFLNRNPGLIVLQHLLEELKMLPDTVLESEADMVLHNFGCRLSYYLALDWNELSKLIRSMPTESYVKEKKE